MRLWLLSVLMVVACFGKDLSNWDAVTGLAQGERVEVSRRTGEGLTGSLAAVTPSSISVRTNNGDVSVVRNDVTSVGHKKFGNGKWVGLVAGAAGGLGAGAALGTRLANEGAANKGGIAAGVGAAGAALGFGIGAAMDSGYKTIYRIK